MTKFTSSDYFKTMASKTRPPLLPDSVVARIDRMIRPKPAADFNDPTWRWLAIRDFVKLAVKVSGFVALLPGLFVMADPLVNGYFLDGHKFTFEQYQAYLQSGRFWSLTATVTVIAWIFSKYFGPLAIYSRNRQRAELAVQKD